MKTNTKFCAYVKKLPCKNCSKGRGVETRTIGINLECDFKLQSISSFEKS